MEVILKMPFLSFSNINVKFAELEKLIWRTYIAAEALLTTNRIELINNKEFAKAALDKNFKTFVIHVAILEVSTTMPIYPSKIS